MLNGYPIVVFGEYGEGRVVWSGLNLPYHAKSYENREEARFLLKMLNWLFPPTKSAPCIASLKRTIPEKIIITIENGTDNTSLLLRETYYPKWHAFVESSKNRMELDVYKAGPDLMFIHLPKDLNYPAKVVFEYETTQIECLGYIISGFSFIVLILYVFLSNIIFRVRK